MSERNLVVLRGALVNEPTARELPSGSVVVQFDVTTRDDAGAQSVPVAWFDPPAGGLAAATGEELVVVGSVRRRFFRTGGVTQSRTEVVARSIVKASRRRSVERAVGAAVEAISRAA